MIAASARSFERDVIEASRQTPVLVDFWAPWCGPCRMLGPMLEKLELQYAGRIRVVKINSDEEQELAAQFQLRSIPYVIAFVDGQPVDAFVGVLPEPQLRAFVEKLLPNPAAIERSKAAALLASGDAEGAASALRAALALEPADDATRWDLAQVLLERLPGTPTPERLHEAGEVLGGASRAAQTEPRHRTLQLLLETLQRSAELPDAAALQARVAAAPADLQARLDLAQLLIAQHAFEPALEQLLEIVMRDRGFGDDAGRKTMLAVFDLMADQPALLASWRRRLSSALNR